MPETAAKPLKIFIHSVDGAGHLNACVGMAQALAKRGHRIQFLLNDAFKGQFAKFGFEELLLKKAPKPDAPKADGPPKNPIKEMAEHLIKSGMLSAKSPLEKLKSDTDSHGFMINIYQTAVEYNPQIGDLIESEKPDVFILDHFLVPPSLPQSGIPYLQLFSGNPLTLYRSDKLPPFGGGFATTSDPESWKEFKELQEKKFLTIFKKYQDDLNAHFNYTPEDEGEGFLGKPKYLNIYGYPEELDYFDIVPLPEKLARVDAFCYEIPEPFVLPAEFAEKPGKTIYVSLGSMGSVDVDLMKRIVSVLAKTNHKYIVSKGPRADEYELPDNCWGEGFLPQTRVLPLVDMVITHGGNNTITETFSFGKPMLVLPLFADQYDNGQRVTEKGFGARLETYAFTDEELISTIDRLLNDEDMNARAKAAAKRIEQSNSKELVCKQIEELVEKVKIGTFV